jgi:hypothetical protein
VLTVFEISVEQNGGSDKHNPVDHDAPEEMVDDLSAVLFTCSHGSWLAGNRVRYIVISTPEQEGEYPCGEGEEQAEGEN